jgi:hypothetical protein
MSVTRLQCGGHPVPEEIERGYAEIGYGTGWCVQCGIHPDHVEKQRLARALSPAQKSKIRRKNLERRAAKHAPLFAEQVITEALEKNSAYYAGETFVPDNYERIGLTFDTRADLNAGQQPAPTAGPHTTGRTRYQQHNNSFGKESS